MQTKAQSCFFCFSFHTTVSFFLLSALTNLAYINVDYGPTQVKCRLLISNICDAMNFQHLLEMLEIMLQHFRKKLEIHCIKNARN